MKKIINLVLLLALTSCATVFSGTTQSINIKAVDARTNEPLSDCFCAITDGQGVNYHVSGNPGIAIVNRGNGVLNVNCKKAGFKQTNVGVGDSFNAVTLVNILFWPGAIVDFASGAYKKYPSHYLVMMEKI